MEMIFLGDVMFNGSESL